MIKVFLDIGAHKGESVDFFRKHHPQGTEFEYYCFECDKRNIEILRERNDIHLIEGAAWVSDEPVKYYFGVDDGGTMYGGKTTGEITSNNWYMVNGIDLASFIKRIWADYIVIKMNCEGAEYNIIPHLEQNNIINCIDKWYIQWHWQKIGLSEAQHNKVAGMIPEFWEWQVYDQSLFIDTFKKSC